ncbi:MAG: hypothetical protein R2795_15900 [Saprospiraceae bacterium]
MVLRLFIIIASLSVWACTRSQNEKNERSYCYEVMKWNADSKLASQDACKLLYQLLKTGDEKILPNDSLWSIVELWHTDDYRKLVHIPKVNDSLLIEISTNILSVRNNQINFQVCSNNKTHMNIELQKLQIGFYDILGDLLFWFNYEYFPEQESNDVIIKPQSTFCMEFNEDAHFVLDLLSKRIPFKECEDQSDCLFDILILTVESVEYNAK